VKSASPTLSSSQPYLQAITLRRHRSQKPFATRWVSERGKMRKKTQSNKDTEGNAMNSKLSLTFGHLRPWDA
jgi:hypothetical protein